MSKRNSNIKSLLLALVVGTLALVTVFAASRTWIGEGLALTVTETEEGYEGTVVLDGEVAATGLLTVTDDGVELGKFTILSEDGEDFSSVEEVLESEGGVQLLEAEEDVKGKTSGWVSGDAELTLTETKDGDIYATYTDGSLSLEGYVNDDVLSGYGLSFSNEEPLSSKTVKAGEEELKKPPRFSYGISAGYLNTRYLVDKLDGAWHVSTPGGYVGLDFAVRLDKKARFTFDLGYMTSFSGYEFKLDGGDYINFGEFCSNNALFAGFSYRLQAGDRLYGGAIFSLGATLSNTTYSGENITNLGPTGKLNFYLGIPGKGRYDYMITLGGMVTPNIVSDLFSQGIDDSLSVVYSAGIGFKVSPKGIGGR